MTDAATDAAASSGAARPRKAIANFPVSGEPIPAPVARWLGRIKAAAARVNAELGLLDADKAERIAAAGDRIAAGELDDQFPIDVFQTGSGTSSNMNANEVIATLAGDGRPRERRRQHGPVLERRLPVGRAPRRARRARQRPAARARRARRLARGEGGRSSTTWSSPAARTGWTPCPSRSARSSAATRRRCARAIARVESTLERARPDPARRHRRRHRAEHAPRVRRARARAARRRHRPDDLAAGRPVRVAGGARRRSSRPPAR